jgi:hypothetical protein
MDIHVKCLLLLSDLNFLDRFLWQPPCKYDYFVKIHPVTAELLSLEEPIDGRTGMAKLTIASRNFAKSNV